MIAFKILIFKCLESRKSEVPNLY